MNPTPTDLRALRAALGLSQSRLVARLPHITLRAWQSWEQGERRCPAYAWAYARAQLGVITLPCATSPPHSAPATPAPQL